MEGAGVRPCSCSQAVKLRWVLWLPEGHVVGGDKAVPGQAGALSGLPMLSVLCKINSCPKPPIPLPCVLSLCCVGDVCVLVSSWGTDTSLGWCRLAVTVCTELLKCTFPLVLFVAVLNCLLFPCVLAHYFLLIHGLCNYLGNAGELAGIWRAWLFFLGVDDFLPMQHGRTGSCPLWVTNCTSRPSHRGSAGQVGCLERPGKHKEQGEGLYVYFLVCLVGLKPELFFDIL